MQADEGADWHFRTIATYSSLLRLHNATDCDT